MGVSVVIRSMRVILLLRITGICVCASSLVRQGEKSIMSCAILVVQKIKSGAHNQVSYAVDPSIK